MPHIHEKIDYAADVFIVNGDTVLLRRHDKSGQWFPPGGHIELDEEPQEAAIREAKEEVGLDVKLVGEVTAPELPGERELLVPRFMNRHSINETHEHIAFIFFGTADSREFSQREIEVSDHIKWFAREELDDSQYGVTERVKHYAKAALDALS